MRSSATAMSSCGVDVEAQRRLDAHAPAPARTCGLVEHREQHLVVRLERHEPEVEQHRRGSWRSARGPRPRRAGSTEPGGAPRSHSSHRSCMPASRPSGTNVVQRRDQRTGVGAAAERVHRDAGLAEAAGHRERGPSAAQHDRGRRGRRQQTVAARPWATDPSWRKLGQARSSVSLQRRSTPAMPPRRASAWRAPGSRRRWPRASRRPSRC